MNADENQAGLTERIIGAVFEVSNTLGSGFLEKVYERALLRELKIRGLAAVSQASFRVMYKGESVGEYFGDIVVEDAVVIELKCADRLGSEHVAQCLNYLRASGKTWIRRENAASGPKGLQLGSSREYRFCEAFYHR